MKVFLIILLVLSGIVALICCILSIRVLIQFDYRDKVFLHIKWAFLKFDILPAGKKKPKPEKPKAEEKPPEEKPPKPETAPKQKKPNPIKAFLNNEGLEGLYEILYQTCQALGGFLGKILRKIKIEELFFSLSVGAGDAASTAIAYGKTASVVFPMLGYICSHMRVGKYDAEVTPDYLSGKTEGELHSLISFRPIVLTNGVVVLLFQLLFRVVIRFLKGIKTPDSSRQTSDKHTTKTTNTNEGGAL